MPAITTITQDGFRSSVPLSSTVVIQSALEALTSNEVDVRCDAVILLSKHIEAHPELTQVLIDMLTDAEPRVRIVTAGQLGNYANDVSTGTAAVKNMLLKGSEEEKLAAAQLVAAKLPELSDLAFEVTKQTAAGGDTMGRGLKYAAIATLGEFNRVDATSLQLIKDALQTDSRYFNSAALHACKHLGSAALPLAADILASLPRHHINAAPNFYFDDAATALANMGLGVIPYLADAARAPVNRDTYLVLRDTLLLLAKSGSLTGQLEKIVSLWQKVVAATPGEFRDSRFLEEISTYGKECFDLLMQHAKDENSVLCREAFRTLGKFKDQSSDVFALILTRLNDSWQSEQAVIEANELLNTGARPDAETSAKLARLILQATPRLLFSNSRFAFYQVVRKIGAPALPGVIGALRTSLDDYSKLGVFQFIKAKDLDLVLLAGLDQIKHIAVGDPAAIAAVGTILNAKVSKIVRSKAHETLTVLRGENLK